MLEKAKQNCLVCAGGTAAACSYNRRLVGGGDGFSITHCCEPSSLPQSSTAFSSARAKEQALACACGEGCKFKHSNTPVLLLALLVCLFVFTLRFYSLPGPLSNCSISHTSLQSRTMRMSLYHPPYLLKEV